MHGDRRRPGLLAALVVAGVLALATAPAVPAAAQEEAACPPDRAKPSDSFDDPTGSRVTDAVASFEEQGVVTTVVAPEDGIPDDALVAAWGVAFPSDDVDPVEAVLCAGTEVPDLVGRTVGDAQKALQDALLVELEDDDA